MATKQKSGLYRAKIKIGVDENGKDVYKYISGKTKRELEDNRQKAIAYYIDGTGLTDDVLFGPYAIQWYHTCKEPDIKPGTRAAYRTALNRYVLPAFGERNLRAIRPSDLQHFFATINAQSHVYLVIAKTIFNSVFRAACADRIVDRNPLDSVQMPRRVETAPDEQRVDKHRALTREERARIEQLCDHEPGALYIALLYYLGLRQGEAAGLRWGDIDWHAGVVHVQRSVDAHACLKPTTPKTSAGIRDVPLPARLATILSPLRGFPDVYILRNTRGRVIDCNCRSSIWREMVNSRCGIPDITAHALRHNYITMCWEAGIDVYATARFVGHSNIATTLSIYTHLSKEREQENIKAVQRLFDSAK